MSFFTIVIMNQTNGVRAYNILCEPPTVEGGANPPVKSITWFRTPPLPEGGQAYFKYTADHYAFVGVAEGGDGGHLSTGDAVMSEGFEHVTLGSVINDGTMVLVSSPDRELRTVDDRAGDGTFQIAIHAGLPTPNPWVVGLARSRQHEDSRAPVAAVELKPRVIYTFTPSAAVYVKGASQHAGNVQPAPSAGARDAARVEIKAPYTKAVVRELNDGSFTVRYGLT
jgi:hypothetical protein